MSFGSPASEADFIQLRVCQLRDVCQAHELDSTGKKADLAVRLAEHGGFRQDEILLLRQTFQSGSPKVNDKNSPRRKTAAKKRRQNGPKLSESDFRKLIWAVEDGSLRCSCGKLLRHRNGRFGLFLFCASGHIERLEKAVLRMQDLVDLSAASLAIFVELPPDASWLCQAEDRLHRQGQRKAELAPASFECPKQQ
eukprot:Skav220377  [mRNA]  locus=scaffold609:287185:289857:- [translate_table: standard]